MTIRISFDNGSKGRMGLMAHFDITWCHKAQAQPALPYYNYRISVYMEITKYHM